MKVGRKGMMGVALASVLILSGCAGTSELAKSETVAFEAYQKANAVVARKEIKVSLAERAKLKAADRATKAQTELVAAEISAEEAKAKLNDVLNE